MNYLLLDGAQIEGLSGRLYDLEADPSIELLYQRTAYADLADVGPLLIALDPGSELAQVFTREWQTSAGIWLESDADAAVLVEHLRSLVHARVEGVTVLLRYYDPRITRLWLGPLTAKERDVLLGPVQRIRLPDDTAATGIERQSALVEPARYADTPWLSLSREQLAHMSQAKLDDFDRCLLAHVQRFYPTCLQHLDGAAQRQWVAHCRQSAAGHGYSSAAEVSRWAGLLAELGDDFPAAPAHAAYRTLLAQPGVLPSRRLDNLMAELLRPDTESPA